MHPLTTIAKILGCLLVVLGVQGCTAVAPPAIALDPAPAHLAFPGTKMKVAGTAPRYVGELPAQLQRFVIALGSGMEGCQSMGLDSAGSLEVVWKGKEPMEYFKATTQITPEVTAEWLGKPLLTLFLHMHASYSAGLADGGQGFVVADAGGEAIAISHYDNAYPAPFPEAWGSLRKLVYSVPRSAWAVKPEDDGFAAYRQMARKLQTNR